MMGSGTWYQTGMLCLVIHCGFKHDWDCDCARTYRHLVRLAKPGRVRA